LVTAAVQGTEIERRTDRWDWCPGCVITRPGQRTLPAPMVGFPAQNGRLERRRTGGTQTLEGWTDACVRLDDGGTTAAGKEARWWVARP